MAKRSLKEKQYLDIVLLAEHLEIELLAFQSGYYQRAPKKISASSLFISLWLMQHIGKNTLRNWAIHLGHQTQQTVSRQSINERLNEKAVQLAELSLQKALNEKINHSRLDHQRQRLGKSLGLFNRIMIRDSTTQQLPGHLHEVFKGSYSCGDPTAIMRIQCLFNFTQKQWEYFKLGSYTDNDQSAAQQVAPLLQAKDLLLQDLGYFTLKWIRQITKDQYLISKWDHKTTLLDEKGQAIDLIDLMKNKKQIDQAILLGSTAKIPMRLVVRRLPKARARKRIEQARKNRHSKAKHSDEYFELLNYEIYITNVSAEMLKAKAIAKLYGLRWYIETLFKSWKSYANFKKIFTKESMKLERVLFTIYALLIQFVWLGAIYNYVQNKIHQIDKTKHLSILKFMDVVSDCFEKIITIHTWNQLENMVKQFFVHATYEKHPHRHNTIQKFLYVKELCIIQ